MKALGVMIFARGKTILVICISAGILPACAYCLDLSVYQFPGKALNGVSVQGFESELGQPIFSKQTSKEGVVHLKRQELSKINYIVIRKDGYFPRTIEITNLSTSVSLMRLGRNEDFSSAAYRTFKGNHLMELCTSVYWTTVTQKKLASYVFLNKAYLLEFDLGNKSDEVLLNYFHLMMLAGSDEHRDAVIKMFCAADLNEDNTSRIQRLYKLVRLSCFDDAWNLVEQKVKTAGLYGEWEKWLSDTPGKFRKPTPTNRGIFGNLQYIQSASDRFFRDCPDAKFRNSKIVDAVFNAENSVGYLIYSNTSSHEGFGMVWKLEGEHWYPWYVDGNSFTVF